MNISKSEILQHNITKLYGPERNSLREQYKNLFTKDGVGDALCDEYGTTPSHWVSSTKDFHKVCFVYNSFSFVIQIFSLKPCKGIKNTILGI